MSIHTLGLWNVVSLHYFCSKNRTLCLQCITSRILICLKESDCAKSDLRERLSWVSLADRNWREGQQTLPSALTPSLWGEVRRGRGWLQGLCSQIYMHFEQRKEMKMSFGRNLSLKSIELSSSHNNIFFSIYLWRNIQMKHYK